MGVARWLLDRTAPLVQRFARAYGLRVDRHFTPLGQGAVVIEDPPEIARDRIPASVMFNTRSGSIRIGSDSVFGEEVMLLTGKHFNVKESAQSGQPLHYVPPSGRDIVVGRHCYIGSRAILIGPVSVGDYAVVAAGAVVTNDVPEYTFVAGVPARAVADLRS
jgi:acetyltransferase-like isoleucine patch superfamily enzyme